MQQKSVLGCLRGSIRWVVHESKMIVRNSSRILVNSDQNQLAWCLRKLAQVKNISLKFASNPAETLVRVFGVTMPLHNDKVRSAPSIQPVPWCFPETTHTKSYPTPNNSSTSFDFEECGTCKDADATWTRICQLVFSSGDSFESEMCSQILVQVSYSRRWSRNAWCHRPLPIGSTLALVLY